MLAGAVVTNHYNVVSDDSAEAKEEKAEAKECPTEDTQELFPRAV
jgi:hypothetical protein